MKVLIVADIHGGFENMKKVIQNDPTFDYLLLVGDLLAGPIGDGYDRDKLAEALNIYKDKIIAVKGNCDYEFDTKLLDFDVDKLYTTIPMDSKKFLMTHGHYYNRDYLPDETYDILITGHTHVPVLERDNGKIIVNPGSISLPRKGSSKCYIVYEDWVFSLKDLDNNKVIERIYI